MIGFKYIVIAACLVGAAACSKPAPAQLSESERQAIELGRADAGKAIDAAPGSQQRESAILHIRANQQKINESGDSAAAAAYARAAEERLDSAGIL